MSNNENTTEVAAPLTFQQRIHNKRVAVAARRALAQDLAAYSAPRELSELVAILRHQEDSDTADIRRILLARHSA
jgi:hypothetical protein